MASRSLNSTQDPDPGLWSIYGSLIFSHIQFLLKQIQSPPFPHLSTNNGLMSIQGMVEQQAQIQDFRSSCNVQFFILKQIQSPPASQF